MFSETLEMNRAPDEATRREYYGVITRESERLSRLIDNVLDFSRIEGGRRRYELGPSPLEPLVHEVMESFPLSPRQQGFKVSVDVEPDLPTCSWMRTPSARPSRTWSTTPSSTPTRAAG
jgi:signal transduction histidine kinase